jgi:hypothetical protein
MKIFFYITLFLFSANIAHADWQFTKWGMSPDQVRTAAATAGWAVRPGRGDAAPWSGATVEFVGPYEIDEFKFEAAYGFKDGGLASVSLKSAGDQCWLIHQRVQDRYGSPDQKFHSNTSADLRWRDQANNNAVVSSVVKSSPPHCWLSYRPLLSSAAKGM